MIYNPPGNPPFRLPASRGNLRNWNLAVNSTAFVGADALIGPWYNVTDSPARIGNEEDYSAGR